MGLALWFLRLGLELWLGLESSLLLLDITRVPGAAGMVATGVVGMVVAIGDIITIGTAVLAGAGVVEAIGHAIIPIIITDAPIMVLMEEVHDVLPMQPVETVELVQV